MFIWHLLFFVGFAIAVVGANAIVPLVTWALLPEKERSSGTRWTVALGGASGLILGWCAYDSHDTKTGNLQLFLFVPFVTVVSMTFVGLLLIAVSSHRRGVLRGPDEVTPPLDDADQRMTSVIRQLPPPAC